MEARNKTQNAGVMDQAWVTGLVKKWNPLVGSIKDPHRRNTTAILLQNELNFVKNGLQEDTLTGNLATYTKYLFPAIRRIFPNLIANDLVSIQPMTGPVGAVFYYEYKYGSNKGKINAGDNLMQTFSPHYSSEKVDTEPVATGDGTNYGGVGLGLNGTLQWTPVRPYNTTTKVSVKLTATNTDATTQTITDNGSGSFAGDGTGTINYQTGRISNVKFTAAPDAGAIITAVYWYNGEMNDQVAELNIDISMEVVQATERRMRARWSNSAGDDMRQMYGLDIEQELVAGFSNKMALEVDREIINDLISNAQHSDSYDFTDFSNDGNEINRIRGVLTTISTMSAAIHKASMRSPANWLVTSPRVSALLMQLQTHGDFAPLVYSKDPSMPYGGGVQTSYRQSSYGPLTSDFGVQAFGTLMNKFMVYVDPLMTDESLILMGLKGQSFLDAGYVHAPYIPMMMTQTLEDPDDFSAKKGIRMRYAKKLLRPEFYGVINVTLP